VKIPWVTTRVLRLKRGGWMDLARFLRRRPTRQRVRALHFYYEKRFRRTRPVRPPRNRVAGATFTLKRFQVEAWQASARKLCCSVRANHMPTLGPVIKKY